MYRKIKKLLSCLLLSLIAQQTFAVSLLDPMSRVDFWRRHFTEVTADSNPLAAQAHGVFDRVSNAAGKRYGQQPQLLILNIDRPDIRLPLAIQGGWIILSEQMLKEMFIVDSESMEGRLAFILGHEIAHQLENDFWNVKFFNAVAAYSRNGSVAEKERVPETLLEISQMAIDKKQSVLKEIKADEQGVLYAALAGYDIGQLFRQRDNNNIGNGTRHKNSIAGEKAFFRDWIDAVYGLSNAVGQQSKSLQQGDYPSLEEREAAIKTRLYAVYQHAQLFQMGIWYYYSEQYQKAVEAFEEFIRYFPEKSAHLNLAASYHRLAIALSDHQEQKSDIPFQLSFDTDPYSNAKFTIFRSLQTTQSNYINYRDKAIKYYETALLQDRSYVPALNNLACLYLLENKPYKAISLLQDAISLDGNNPDLFNNIAIAFYKISDKEKADEHLKRSLDIDSGYAVASLNLSLMAMEAGDEKTAKQFWKQYLDQGMIDDWARLVEQRYAPKFTLERTAPSLDVELLEQLSAGISTDNIPAKWHATLMRDLSLANNNYKLIEYKNGLTILSEDDEITMVVATGKFRGKSSFDLKVGDSSKAVIEQYGMPNHRLSTTQGEALSYLERGVTFIVTDHRVSSWIVY